MNYSFDFSPVFAAWPMLLDGVMGTLRMSSISMVLGLSLGIVFMSMRMSRQPVLRSVAIGYIELIRNTPILVQVFFVFFGMPAIGIRLSGEQAAILAMTLNCAAYAAEIVRGGVQSIRPGQIEAGRALGLHTADIYRFIVFRPAIRAVYSAPPNDNKPAIAGFSFAFPHIVQKVYTPIPEHSASYMTQSFSHIKADPW